jgi:hypothetical protein
MPHRLSYEKAAFVRVVTLPKRLERWPLLTVETDETEANVDSKSTN